MNRISTSSSYLSVIANLNQAQLRQMQAGDQVSSQKKGDDLKDYARSAETLTAMNSVRTRLQGFIEQSDVLADRFTSQNVALTKLADTVVGARQAITDALASGRADTLMQELRGFFTDAVAALNSRNQGKYLFSGGALNTLPVTATSMSDLTGTPAVADLFQNDDFKAISRLDETTTINGSFLAEELGTELFEAFKLIQAADQQIPGPGPGPFNGQLTEAQMNFLSSTLDDFDQVHASIVNQAAVNGSYQRRIEDNHADLVARDNTLAAMIGGVTDVDVAEAISRLQQAQMAVQASAQVFSGLQSSSLLNYLRP